MTQIPDAVGVYEDEDGDLWVRFGDGYDKWLHLVQYMVQWKPNLINRSWMSEFVTDDDVAEHLPLKCISNETKGEER